MLRTGIEQDQPRSSLPGQLLSPGQAASPSIPGGNFEHPGREHPERECPAWNVLPGMSRLECPVWECRASRGSRAALQAILHPWHPCPSAPGPASRLTRPELTEEDYPLPGSRSDCVYSRTWADLLVGAHH